MVKSTIKIILVLLITQITIIASGIDVSIYGISRRLTLFGYIVVIGLPLAIIFLGIWMFLKRGRKLH